MTDVLVTIVYYAWIVAMVISVPMGIYCLLVLPILKLWYVLKGEDDYEKD